MKLALRKLAAHLVTTRAFGWSAAKLVAGYLRTLRVQVVCERPEVHPTVATRGCIYCSWHENILLSSYIVGCNDVRALVSSSRDGEYLARIMEAMGYRTIRGSSKRGAIRAVRQMVREGGSTGIAITPDGPRGPRREFQQGAVYFASRTGLRLVPSGFAYDRPWRASSWDRFAVPRPFTRAVVYGAEPIEVPADANLETLAQYRRLAEEAMHFATQQAERLLAERPPNARLSNPGPGRQIPQQAVRTAA